MKKNALLFLTSFSFFMAADVQAQEWFAENACCIRETNLYAKIFTGANFLQNTSLDGNSTTYKTGYVIAGAVGYRWCNGLRLETEYAYRRNAIKNIDFYIEDSATEGHFQTSSYMANLLWDLTLPTRGCATWNIQPFIGVGIGRDFQKMHASNCRFNFNQKWNHFAWQLMAGIAYPIFCNTNITFEYRFHQGSCHFNNHALGVGFVYNFDFFR